MHALNIIKRLNAEVPVKVKVEKPASAKLAFWNLVKKSK